MFTQDVVEAMKFNENPTKYLDDYLAKKKREILGIQDIESRESMLPYAPFICSSCSKLFIKDQAIVQQGMCDVCHGKIIANASAVDFEEPKSGELYECMACGEQSDLSTIEDNDSACTACQGKHFVKSALLERVMENTTDINLSEGLPLVDVWKEVGGKVYAHYQYELEDEQDEDSRVVNFVACASGQFTEKDFLRFDWNDGDPVAKVYTSTKGPYPDPNLKCACAWAFDTGDVEVPEYIDARNNIIQKGDSVEYILKTGPVAGVVDDLTPAGVKVALSKHPDFGHNLEGRDDSKIVLTQEDIVANRVIAN